MTRNEITVINWAGLNYGDDEIFNVCYNLFFKENFEKINIISDYPNKFEHLNNVYPISRVFGLKKNWAKIIGAIFNSRKVFCGGGDIISGDIGTSLALLIACALKKNIIIAGVGVTEIQSKNKILKSIKKKLQKYILNKAKIILLRDNNSLNSLKSYIQNSNIYVLPDLLFLHELLEESNESLKEFKIELDSNKNYFAVSIVPTSKMYNNRWGEKEYELFANMIDRLIEQNFTPIFLSSICKKDISKTTYDIVTDDDIADIIINKMKYKNCSIVVKESLNIDEISYILKTCKFAILTRLHYIITSIIKRIPFLALSYAPKVNNILKEVNLEKYSISWPIVNKDLFVENVINLHKNRREIIMDIDNSIEYYSKDISQLYNILEKEFELSN